MKDNTSAMQKIISRHMEAAFDEMHQTLGETPTDIQIVIMEAYRDNGTDSDGIYQGCKVTTSCRTIE
ncbi:MULTISPECIES: hypothetical protein [unclassified Halomonas]|uniref:hypothetical protein n=1 Tax=unclassified Halomonas TaxID=2609666 RepID=UPI0040347403